MTTFISCRPEDPALSCSCTLRTQNRYNTLVYGEEVRAEPGRKVMCSESVMFLHIGSVSLSFPPSVKRFRSLKKTYKENALCSFCCFTDCHGLSLKIKESGSSLNLLSWIFPCVTGFEGWPVVISTVL